MSGWVTSMETHHPLSYEKLFVFRQYNFNLLNIKWVQSLQLQKELTQFEWVRSL